jgi:hypothetical protein
MLAPTVVLESTRNGILARTEGDADARTLIRSLAVVDQLATRAPSARTALRVRTAIADAMAESGTAQELLLELFDRGELFQAVLSLSSDARGELLQASIELGFEPPAGWREHAALGEWFRSVVDGTSGPAGDDDPHPLIRLQEIERARRRAEAQLSAGRAAARRAFIADAAEPLRDLEETVDSYVQLWLGLARIGIKQIAALGEVLSREEIDPERHEVVESRAASIYVVRSQGIAVEGEVVRRARLEAID